MHVSNRRLGGLDFVVNNVGRSAIGVELTVHGHVDVLDGPVGGEDFADVSFVDVFRELLHHDFGAS